MAALLAEINYNRSKLLPHYATFVGDMQNFLELVAELVQGEFLQRHQAQEAVRHELCALIQHKPFYIL